MSEMDEHSEELVMSEKDEHSSQTGSRRRDALLRFGRYAAVAPTTMVLLTGKSEAYSEAWGGKDGDREPGKGD